MNQESSQVSNRADPKVNTHDDTPGDSIFGDPMVKYFTITGILALVSLIALVVYYIISHIEAKRALLQDRQAHSMMHVPSNNPTPKKNYNSQSETTPAGATGGRYAIPLLMRSASRK